MTPGVSSNWRPTATLSALGARAALLSDIRAFFAERGVLEVETPILSRAGTTDPNIHSMSVCLQTAERVDRYYLQTSPEFAMKRLLAAGTGPIYQIARVFRCAERGCLHNPEFSLLEWYRPGYDHHALMDEVGQFLTVTTGLAAGQRQTYAQAFEDYVGIDPLQASDDKLRALASTAGLVAVQQSDRDGLLDFLMGTMVIPSLGRDGYDIVYDYPASQAALARISGADARVAERFEVFANGVELANGFHELTDADEQAQRFANDRMRRREMGLGDIPADDHLIAALRHGLTPCAGVAIGLDRVLMLRLGSEHIDEVLAFPIEYA